MAKKSKEEIKKLKAKADSGDIKAAFEYAYLLEDDEDNSANLDRKEALKYYDIVIKNGGDDYRVAYACYNSALILYNGSKEENIKVNKKEAAKFFKMAADRGDGDAIYKYARMLESGDGIKQNKKEAEKYYSKDNDVLIKKMKDELKKLGYKIGKLKGAGGEGTVYSAVDPNGKKIVVKFPVTKKRRNILKRGKIRVKKRINEYFDIIGNGFTKVLNSHEIEISGTTYLVETFKERETDLDNKLNETIFNKNKKSLQIMPIMAQLILALKAAHLKGLIFADIKPENVLINKNDRLKLSDLGFSNFANYFKENRSFCGTRVYMANEVLKGYFYGDRDSYINEKSDVYSMGIMFLEMFTQKSIYDFLEELNGNKEIDYSDYDKFCEIRSDLDKKITLDDIKLNGLFPGIDFDNENKDKQMEIKEKILEMLKIMLRDDYRERATIFEVEEKFIELTNYMSENITKNNKNVSIKEDLGIEDKELMKLGILDKAKINTAAKNFKDKLNKDINEKDLSDEAKNCLNILQNSIDENGNIKQMDEDDNFYSNMSKLSEQNKLEFLKIFDKKNQFDSLRLMAEENRIENINNLSLERIININPEMIEHLFVLNLNKNEIFELKVDHEKLMNDLNLYPNKKYEDLTFEEKEELMVKYNELGNGKKDYGINYNEINITLDNDYILSKWIKVLFKHSCKNSDEFAIKFLLQNREMQKIVKNNITESFLAIFECKDIKIIEEILDFTKKNNIEISDNLLLSGFKKIFEAGDLELITELMLSSERINSIVMEEELKEGFKIACENGNYNMIESILNLKIIQFSEKDEDLINECFKIACEKEHTDVVKAILHTVIGSMVKEENIKECFKTACIEKRGKVFQGLLEDSNLKIFNNEDLKECFKMACINGCENIISGINFDVLDKETLGEGFELASNNNVKEQLIEGIMNKKESLLFRCLKNGNMELAKILFDNGVNFGTAKFNRMEDDGFIENFKKFIEEEIKISINYEDDEDSLTWYLNKLTEKNGITAQKLNFVLWAVEEKIEEGLKKEEEGKKEEIFEEVEEKEIKENLDKASSEMESVSSQKEEDFDDLELFRNPPPNFSVKI